MSRTTAHRPFRLRRRIVTLAAAVAFVIVPAIAGVRGRRNPDGDVFNAVKTWSVLAAVWLILAARLWLGPDVAWWPVLVTLIFFLNILEAVLSDAARGVWINVASGALLLLSIPGWSRISLGAAPPHDLLYAIPWPWLVGYTAWNYAFLVNRRPHLASVHGAVLLAPLLGETLWPGIWGQGRATTLAAHQLLSYGWWDRRQALNVHGHDAAKLRLGRALLPVALVTCLWAAVASGTGLSPAW